MRILLIEPPINCFTGLLKRGYPLGLCMLAAIAREEKMEAVMVYDVDKCHIVTDGLNFTDQRRNMELFLSGINDAQHPVWTEIENTLKSFQPEVVGITTMTMNYASALRTAEKVKKWNEDCVVLMGGAHASVMPAPMIEWPFTDAVVRGEGEEAFRKILRRLGSGTTDLSGISGVITKNDLQATHEGPLEVGDLDALPFPDRSVLMCPERYSAEDMGLILTSRGCPFHCSYCSNFTRKTRFRSIENVFEEIRSVRSRYGTVQFLIKDDSFTLRRKRVEDFCRHVIEGGVEFVWESTTRLDLLDYSLVRLMKRAACNRVGVGVESGDDEILRVLNKRMTKDRIRSSTSILNNHNVFWTGYFMMGLPMETEEQMMSTVDFMKTLAPPYAALGIYKPYPGTKLFDLSAEYGLVHSEVSNDHFLTTNPVDYFLKDPLRRSAKVSAERLTHLTGLMEREFDRSNKKVQNIVKRAWSRRSLYYSSPSNLVSDTVRALKWIGPR